jgi:hypothetical protein
MATGSKGLRRNSSVPSGDGVTQVTPGSYPDGEDRQFSETASLDALRAGSRRKNDVGQTTKARQVALVEQLTQGLRSPTPDRYSHG